MRFIVITTVDGSPTKKSVIASSADAVKSFYPNSKIILLKPDVTFESALKLLAKKSEKS